MSFVTKSKKPRLKVIVIVTAYKVAGLLAPTIQRIPKKTWQVIDEVMIFNDASPDDTAREAKALKKQFPKISVITNPENIGYANTQKKAYEFALKKDADIVALLHGDGQYAPEELYALLQPLLKRQADIVQGSRILGGKALEGHMPLYKFIANRTLSTLENLAFHMQMAEYHSGYMLYSRHALTTIPFHKLTDTFHFDGEMLIMGKLTGLRIKEVPITTTYAGETSSLKPIPYGFQVLKTILSYWQGHYHRLLKR